MKRSLLAAKKLNVQMNSLPSVAVLLHIEMMKWAIVITTPTVLCVVTLTAKQKLQLVAGFMPHIEPKLNARMDWPLLVSVALIIKEIAQIITFWVSDAVKYDPFLK